MKNKSYWVATTPATNYPSLEKNIDIDVVIIGGGLTGINTAYFLQKQGLKIAIIEQNRIGTGTSGYTTAKITSLHKLIYDYLISTFGQENAQIYADSNQWAVEEIAKIIKENKIVCDFQRLPAFTYTQTDEGVEKIQKEVQATKKLNLPVSFTTSSPYSSLGIKASIRFDNQSLFHPRKYLLALAEIITDNHNYIFEQTRVTDIKGNNPYEVITDKGNIIAKHVIIATNYPFYKSNLFIDKLTQSGSFISATKLQGSDPQGMYIGIEETGLSFRPQINDKNKILITAGNNLNKLIKLSKKYFPISDTLYYWSAQDSMSIDQVPLIGSIDNNSNIYIATGFNKWGITKSVISAKILTDLILESKNPWANFYNPARIKSTLKKTMKPTDIKNNEAKVIDYNNQKVAVYKDEKGTIHARSAVCTHMGCIVGWNNKDKTWDCPCHGSRFNLDGKVINGPAQKDLSPIYLFPKINTP